MKLRIMGLPDEVAATVAAISTVLDVVSVSSPYPMRGQSREVRVYVDARPLADAPKSTGAVS